MRDFKKTLEWHRNHQTRAAIGFNPDGMCLKICRTARGIGAVYPTAKAAQDATPKKHRFHKVSDLRAGMVLYYDDPNDSNRAGHIVTMAGRVKGADRNKLSDILVWTNSVQSGRVTLVRGDYFVRYWGDPFQFGSDWLNGMELDYYGKKPKGGTSIKRTRVERARRLLEKAMDRAFRKGKDKRGRRISKMLDEGPRR